MDLEPSTRRWIDRCAMAALYVFGLAFWAVMFKGQEGFKWAEFHSMDWILSRQFLSILRHAIVEWTIPYLCSCVNYTDHFLGLPVAPCSPQFFVLAWLNDVQFLIFNHALMHTVFFCGVVAIRRELRLSLLSFTWLYVLFGFNGYIVSHVSVGHLMWYGYFLLPFFCLLMLRLEEKPWNARERIMMAFLLFLILLQGGFHTFSWCALYLAIYAFARPLSALSIFQALSLAGFLCACRFLPTLVALRQIGRMYYFLGFNDPVELIRAFTTLQDFSGLYEEIRWERDYYIGAAAFFVLAFYLARPFFRKPLESEPGLFAGLHAANLVMVMFSMGWIARVFSYLPLLNSQRVPSRFMTIPMVMWIVMGVAQMNAKRRGSKERSPGFQLNLAMLGFTVFNLVTHMIKWRLAKVEAFEPGAPPGDFNAKIVPFSLNNPPDMNVYLASVWIGFAITLLAATYCLWRYSREKRRDGVARGGTSFPWR
jgi:hypothetical protein